jgi:hypothetical protein
MLREQINGANEDIKADIKRIDNDVGQLQAHFLTTDQDVARLYDNGIHDRDDINDLLRDIEILEKD